MPVYSQNSQYLAATSQWKRCRDAVGGTDTVKRAMTSYLPLLEGHAEQQSKGYGGYLTRALFYPAMLRTMQGLLGLIMAKPASIENVPKLQEKELEDVTLAGSSLEDYSRMLCQEVLTTGRAGTLIDMAEENGARPYWVLYPAETIVNWQEERIAGKKTLTLVVLFEEKELVNPKDEFIPEIRKQYRVLRLFSGIYTVEIYVENHKKQGEWEVIDQRTPLRRGRPLNYIPFVFLNPTSIDTGIEHPPLLDLADVNFSHYRTSADEEHAAHYTALPTPWITGHDINPGEQLAIGSATAWVIPNPAANVGMLEFSGAGLQALAALKEQKRQMMVTLGARMLETQKNTQEAATTVAMRHAGERSSLSVLALALGQCVQIALQWHLFWSGIEESTAQKAEIAFNPETMDLMTAEDIKMLVTTWQAGAISHKTLYSNLEYAEYTRQGVDFEEELQDIEEETPELPEPVMVPGEALPVGAPKPKIVPPIER